MKIMEGLMQALVVKQPDDPIKYLLGLLDNNKSMQDVLNEIDTYSKAPSKK
jgi:hypothetical protein